MRASSWWLVVLCVACGPATSDPGTDDGSSPSTSSSASTSSPSSGEVDASGPASTVADSTSTGPTPVDCAPLDADACEAEPACEPLWAQAEFEFGCVEEPIFVGCQPADCPGSPCWICEGLSVDPRHWAPNCGCLPEPWDTCGSGSNAPAQCECTSNAECPESWQLCDEGFCRGCDDWIQQCNCMSLGCAPGRCCGWEGYCVGGDPLPDGSCSLR